MMQSASGVLSSGTPLTIPNAAAWQNPAPNRWLKPLIFEGVSTGKCVIVFGIASNTGPVLAWSRPFYLDLRKVTDLYEHWTVGDNITTEWNQIPPEATRVPDSTTFGPPKSSAESDYILFVHGWRMRPWERRAFASTSYKRLWHQNYQGRFGFYSWPTDWWSLGTDWYSPSTWINYFNGVVLDAQNFDRSERRAWNSGIALLNLAADLGHTYPGKLRVMAHSMGNIVVSESLRLSTDMTLGRIYHTYAAMQAAVASHCYDSSAPIRTLNSLVGVNNDSSTFNLYRYFWEPYPVIPPSYLHWKTYLNDVNGAGRMLNLLNPLDAALSSWRYDQDLKPDSGYDYRIQDGFYEKGVFGTVKRRLHPFYQRYEIFAYGAEARCYALGAQVNVGGPFQNSQVNLNTTFGLQGNSYEHSAKFNSTVQARSAFWKRVIAEFDF